MSLNRGIKCHFNGASSELFVAYKATLAGFIVSYPLFTQSRYDLIIDTGSRLLKVQVKKAVESSARGNRFIQIRLGGCGHPEYTDASYDFIAVVYKENVWMLPYNETAFHKSMSFSIFSEKSKSTKFLSERTFDKFVEKFKNVVH